MTRQMEFIGPVDIGIGPDFDIGYGVVEAFEICEEHEPYQNFNSYGYAFDEETARLFSASRDLANATMRLMKHVAVAMDDAVDVRDYNFLSMDLIKAREALKKAGIKPTC